MATVQPIAVRSFISEHNRSLEAKRDISRWFLYETMVVDFGDSVGRPSSLITLQKEYLTRFLENGWTIDAVMRTSEEGRWTTLRKSSSKSDTSGSETTAGASTGGARSSGITTESYSGHSTDNTASNSTNNTSQSNSSNENSNSNSNSSSESSSTQTNSSTSSNTTTKDSTDTITTNNNTRNSSSSSSGSGSSSSSSSSTHGTTTNTVHDVTQNDTESESTSQSNSKSSSNSNSNSSMTESGSSNSNQTQNDTSNTNIISGGITTTNRSESETEAQNTSSNSVSSGHEAESGTEEYEGDAYWAAVQRVRLKRRRMQPELVLQDMIDSYVVQFNDGIRNEDSRFNELVTLYGVMLNRNETEGNAIVSGALDVTGLFNKLSASIDITWSAANNAAMETWRQGAEGNVAEIRYKYEALISITRAKMVEQGTYNGTVWPTVEAGIVRHMEAAIAEARTNGMATANKVMTDVLNAKGDVMAQLVNAKNAIAAQIDQRKITVIELRNTVLQSMLNFMGSRSDAFPQIQEISQLASQIGFTVGAAGNVL